MPTPFKLKCVLSAFCLLAVAVIQLRAQTPTMKDPWEPWKFLLGTWKGIGPGEPGPEGTGGFSLNFKLDKKILVRKNWAEVAPKPGEKTGVKHEDLMIIYPQIGEARFRAIYFDNEGHVINYVVSFPSKQPAVTFESEASQPGLRYRLTYDVDAKGQLAIVFSIAPPGQPFRVYTKGLAQKEK